MKAYWQRIRAIEASLPAFVWLEAQGHVVEVSAANAAPLLLAKSHRLATVEEIEAHRDAEHSTQRAVRREELERQGIAVVRV